MRKTIKDDFSFTKKEIHANNEATPRTAANQIYHGAPARIRITKIHQLRKILPYVQRIQQSEAYPMTMVRKIRMIGSIGSIMYCLVKVERGLLLSLLCLSTRVVFM